MMWQTQTTIEYPFALRPASIEEAGLFYSQMDEAEDAVLGTVGHIRMDFGASGKEFYHTWWPHNGDQFNTGEFKDELQKFVDMLRSDGPLTNLASMRNYCYQHGGRVVHVLVALITSGKAPAAVPVTVRFLPVAVADLAALHRDAVGGDAAGGVLPVGEQILHVLCLHMEVPVAASGLVQFLPQRLNIPSHLLDLLVVHHLTEVIFQRILGKIRQGLVHGVMLLWRGGDADAAVGGIRTKWLICLRQSIQSR